MIDKQAIASGNTLTKQKIKALCHIGDFAKVADLLNANGHDTSRQRVRWWLNVAKMPSKIESEIIQAFAAVFAEREERMQDAVAALNNARRAFAKTARMLSE